MCSIKQKVQSTVKKSVTALLEQQDGQGCWSFPAHLGSHYISLYALFLEWLRFRGFSSLLNLNRLATILVETQLADGSWKQARDPAIPSGDINATVLNYAALKFFRASISVANVEPAMNAARRFILAAGGIDATNQFTKTFLALFGLRGWEEISEIPYLLFLEALPLNYRQFSQWVIPHLLPMAYLRHNRVSRKMPGSLGRRARKKTNPPLGMTDSWSAKSSGSRGSMEAGADIRFQPCSASRRWTIFTENIPCASPPFRERSSADSASRINCILTTERGTTSAA